ncbi:MAG: putative structural protein [Prokaryotic dsDNA virus sp.]|nr:MAG: putative structural protein [Prokaryotic dsDNA virus sp.]|tara:strand:- start:38105 stop:40540 length:2436 start_codon:yes stop_codon:yes gene_type:complete
MKDIKINIASQGFPSQFVSDSEKATDEFGLQIGQAIQYEWFRKDGNQCRYYNQWRDFNRLRLYARGEQPIQKYKNELAVDGDLSYLNLDWTPVPIIPKFVDIVVNGMADRLFKVNAYAQDAMSQSNRSKYQEMIQGQMVAKPVLNIIKKEGGVNPFTMNPNDLPQNDEELSLYMQIQYKPAIEIAQEEAIDTLFDNNKYHDLRKRFDYDLMVLGIGIAKHEFLPGSGVKVSYVDPANVVYSYTEDPHFKDCFYWGEIKTLPIIELKKIDTSLTNEDLEEISKYSQSWYNYYNTAQFYENDIFYRDTATVMYFNYKTTKTFVYKKKVTDNGNSKMIEKDDQFNPPQEMMEEGKFEKISKTIDVWYEGVMVMGTNILLKWELAENMVRPKSANQYAIPNYVAVAPRMYKGVIESLVRRMIPFADLIQITHLKLQQVISRTVPDGVFIDADGLNEVDLGTGNAYNPEDALRLYFQTGSVIGRSYTQEGDYNQGKVPITQLNGTTGAGKTQMLIANYNHYLDMIRSCTGLNEARDGSTPDPNSLVGVQKLAALNSNTATRHILDGSLFIYRSLAEALSYRVADILQFADFKEVFVNQIGKYNVSILNDTKELYLYDFGIFIEVAPDEEEKQQLEQNIQMALQKQDINLEDAIEIRELRNLKLANQLLKLKRSKKQESDRNFEMQKQQQQQQAQQQSQQMAAEMAMQKLQAENQAKMQLKQTEIAFEIEKMTKEAELKAQLMDKEFGFNQQLRGISEQGLQQRETEREEAKKERISQQNTQQSKLINQRKNNLPPQNFESNEDSLDGFDLAEFSPR